MNIRPLGDKILIKKSEPEKVSSGGIIIPDNATDQRAVHEATIVAVGRGRVLDSGRLVEPTVKSGDRVLVAKYAGTKIEIEGEEHYIVQSDDVHGVVEAG